MALIKKTICEFIFILVVGFFLTSSSTELATNCPRMLNFVFEYSAPLGNQSAGNYTEFSKVDLKSCVDNCCKNLTCNVAFIYNHTCYHVNCISTELCLPLRRTNMSTDLKMVLVKPVDPTQTWNDVMKEFPDFKETVLKEEKARQIQKQRLKQKQFVFEDTSNYVDELPNNNFNHFDINENLYKTLAENEALNLGSPRRMNDIYGFERFANDPYPNDELADLQMQEANSAFKRFKPNLCDPNLSNSGCSNFEDCIPMVDSTLKGICRCKKFFYRNDLGKCVPRSIPAGLTEKILRHNINLNDGEDRDDLLGSEQEPEVIAKQEPEKPKIIPLTVSVEAKSIQLPINEAALTALVMPDEMKTEDKYTYAWQLIAKPTGDINGTMTDQTKNVVKLSNLSEGVYSFKVTVTGNHTFGEGYSNVTVSPAKRNNKPPVVMITPKQQVIKLPNKKAILDGSPSTDDDKIVSWKWELVQGPIGYSPTLQQVSTIELDDLTSPGNYTFKLTATDSDNAENSTTATIQVLQEVDYPPQSNAGPDVILYLPHNSVVLNGTLSTDDHEIVAWEWTKDSSDESKAVDMQNTRTPYLTLSHLEEGIYTFELKVMDVKNQSSTSKVHVFVKPPTNLPPVPSAGKNETINLPQTWAILNATESKDDIKITQYYWKQIGGPTTSVILNTNSSIANATALTLGDYVFEVMVIDESNNNATDKVHVTIVQEKNTPPVARAGGNLTVTLPLSVIYLNGSQSSDDLGVANYTWTRESGSLAVGDVIGNSDREAVLMLTNIVPGHYIFKLTVADDQGLTSSDTVYVTVHHDKLIMDLVEVILTAQATTLSQEQLDQLKQKLVLLLGDNVKLHVRDLRVDQKTGHVILVFFVEKANKDTGKFAIMPALEVEKILKEKFWRDFSILGSSIKEIRTVVCQNDCSGHGVCDTETLACICETFWMPDIFFYWGVSEPNCDWSVLYVIVFIFIIFLIISGLCWGLTYSCRKRKKTPVTKTASATRRRVKKTNYNLLKQDDENPPFSRNTLTDSDTDSDVLFENSRQKNGVRNGQLKNGKNQRFTKLGRRVKT